MKRKGNKKEKIEYDIKFLAKKPLEYQADYKIALIGNCRVGKSCFAVRATKNIFKENILYTTGYEYHLLNIEVNNISMKLEIWDTCGQEAYRTLSANFYRNCTIGLVVYSVTDRASFEEIEDWGNQLKEKTENKVVMFLLGNKADVNETERVVSTDEGENLKEKLGYYKFFEVSAKSGLNWKEVFTEIAKVLYEKYKEGQNKLGNSFSIIEGKKKKKECC